MSVVTFESFAAELKKARIEKQISLMDISASTRINLKFLESIEEGNFAVLPQTYVRAFIREYAEAVGYDPKEAMKKYDALRHPRQAEKTEGAPAPFGGTTVKAGRREENRVLVFARQNALFIGVLAVVAVFVVYLTRPVSDTNAANEIAETPFDKVVRENQAAVPVQQDPIALPIVPKPVVSDSLHLEMTTSDSVWMTVRLDGGQPLEYLFGPNRKGSWKAKDQFQITMGNAGGANFVLDGHDLGPLGKRGAVVRNVSLSKANLPKP